MKHLNQLSVAIMVSSIVGGLYIGKKKEISQEALAGDSDGGKSTSLNLVTGPEITGAFGWKLGDSLPGGVQCNPDGLTSMCAVKRDDGKYDVFSVCEVAGKELLPEQWKMRACITPKSRTIFGIEVTTAIDVNTKPQIGALIDGLNKKYGAGTALSETLLQYSTGSSWISVNSGGGRINLGQFLVTIGKVRMNYGSYKYNAVAVNELRELELDEVQKAKGQIKVDGL
jgi:hypothetical protein